MLTLFYKVDGDDTWYKHVSFSFDFMTKNVQRMTGIAINNIRAGVWSNAQLRYTFGDIMWDYHYGFEFTIPENHEKIKRILRAAQKAKVDIGAWVDVGGHYHIDPIVYNNEVQALRVY